MGGSTLLLSATRHVSVRYWPNTKLCWRLICTPGYVYTYSLFNNAIIMQREQVANADKTKLFLFTKSKSIQEFTAAKLFGKDVILSNSTKVLRVEPDSKLNLKLHIQRAHKRIRKSTATLWQCRRLFGKNWGLKPKVFKWMYKIISRSTLYYAAIV